MCLPVVLWTKRNHIVNRVASRIAQRNNVMGFQIEAAVCCGKPLNIAILAFSFCAFNRVCSYSIITFYDLDNDACPIWKLISLWRSRQVINGILYFCASYQSVIAGFFVKSGHMPNSWIQLPF